MNKMTTLNLKFDEFWKQFESDRDNFPKMHYLKTNKQFEFYFMSKQKILYSTIATMKKIKAWTDAKEIEFEVFVEEFMLKYCSNAIELATEAEISDIAPPVLKTLEPEDSVDEAKDYGEFIAQTFRKWEKKILSALDTIEIEKCQEDTLKTMGEFLQRVANSINSRPFIDKIRKYIKKSLVAGMESAEEESDTQIGFTTMFAKKLDFLEDQQFNGYTLPDGKKWYGLKGVSHDIQTKIYKSVQDDIVNKRSKSEMAGNIRELFDGLSVNRSKVIARTETTRFLNEGKLTGYKEAGIKGNKAWSAVMDGNTSALDRRLHNKYFDKGVAFDDWFVDDVTGKRFQIPPSHPNCRCSTELRIPIKN